ncbi:MAG: LacI family DNA-binding transcriptional regulator [Sphaerochaetaceae bacterium]
MENTRRVTLKTIAKELGISFSTVSKAMNDNPHIKKETKELIRQKAHELGYSPNTSARNLRTNKSHSISIIFNDLANPILTSIFDHIATEMAKQNYSTMVCDSKFDPFLERKHIVKAIANGSDIIFLEPTSLSKKNFNLLNNWVDRVVLFGSSHPDIETSKITINYFHGGYLSAKEILEKGHSDAYTFTTTTDFPPSFEFVSGIKKAFNEYGLNYDSSKIIEMESSIDDGFKYACKILEDRKHNGKSHVSFITFCDIQAIGIYKAADYFRLNIPNDISVIGHDDYPFSPYVAPKLTTINLPVNRIANNSIAAVKSILESKNQRLIFNIEPTIVVRESVKNLWEEN